MFHSFLSLNFHILLGIIIINLDKSSIHGPSISIGGIAMLKSPGGLRDHDSGCAARSDSLPGVVLRLAMDGQYTKYLSW